MRVLAICRVSKEEQATADHHSLDWQEATIRRYAAERSWVVVDVVRYVQSGGANQGELDKILSRIHAQRIEVVAVTEVDRLARDMVSSLLFLEELSKQGCRFVAVADGLDLSQPDGELRMMLLSLFAHYFRTQLSRKIRGAARRGGARGCGQAISRTAINWDRMPIWFRTRPLLRWYVGFTRPIWTGGDITALRRR